MTTLPIYTGIMPASLKPLNLTHYYLLLTWIYFRPTALKNYLYTVDPDLYKARPGKSILHSLSMPAYQSLYSMAILLAIFLSMVISFIVVFLTDWNRDISALNGWVNWLAGNLIGVGVGLAFGFIFRLTFGVASGVTFGVASSVALGAGLGVGSGPLNGPLSGTLSELSLVVLGIGLGLAFGVGLNVSFGLPGSTLFGFLVGLGLSIVFGVAYDERSSLVFGLAWLFGLLRLLFYPLHICRMVIAKEWLLGDELLILPLFSMKATLHRLMAQNPATGLRHLITVAQNPFQRWVAQSVLQEHIHQIDKPLHFLYELITTPEFDVYAFAPVNEFDWDRVPTVSVLLLGEIRGTWITCSTDPTCHLAERFVWHLTYRGRDFRNTPLTRFASLLFRLLNEDDLVTDTFNLSKFRHAYEALAEYEGGHEITYSFDLMAECMSYDDLNSLADATAKLLTLEVGEQPIRPLVVVTLTQLGKVGFEVAICLTSTSRTNKLAALARAADTLNRLRTALIPDINAPEQKILYHIIRQWRSLVIEAGGEAGRTTQIGPVANPYVAGNPVTGELFTGRDTIMRRLDELWSGNGQWPSIILYGHRRMGKTSILQNLEAKFGKRAVIADFNMQRMGLVDNTGELLYNMALALYDVFPNDVPEPQEERFLQHNPFTAFDRFVKILDTARSDRRVVVTIDEFELIEALIIQGKVDARLLDFGRALIQTYKWVVLVLAGLHTLREMTYDYWHPLFGSVTAVPVSFLSPEASRHLITQPDPDFSLDYDSEAVEYIYALTNGQPYLTQLIGHGLVARYNRQMLEADTKRSRFFTQEDVEAVLIGDDFFRDGNAYFTGVWHQAETGSAPEQITVLTAMATATTPCTIDEIAVRTGLPSDIVANALDELTRHDVTQETDEGWSFTVELMKRWVFRSQQVSAPSSPVSVPHKTPLQA